MSGNSSIKSVIVELQVSDPVEVQPGQFETTFTHPNLTGAFVLKHGTDREALLNAVSIDIKQIDPVSALFRNLVEWKNSKQEVSP